jgi:hypothetical protein
MPYYAREYPVEHMPLPDVQVKVPVDLPVITNYNSTSLYCMYYVRHHSVSPTVQNVTLNCIHYSTVYSA